MNDFESAKLQRFSQAVYREVDEQIFSILEEATEMKNQIIDSSTDEGLEDAYNQIKEQKKKIELKYVRDISSAELENQRRVLLHRKELEKRLFDSVTARVIKFTESEEYTQWLSKKLESVSLENATLYVKSSDKEKISALVKEGVIVCESDEILLGGFMAYYEEGKLCDYTLDTALCDAKEQFINKALLKINETSGKEE